MTKIYPLSVVAVLAVIVVTAILAGSAVGVFLSAPSAIVVLGITIALTLASHRPSEIRTAFSAAHGSTDPAELRLAVAFFAALQRYALWAGFLATMMGVIVLLTYLGDATHVGSGTAIALITVFYSIVFLMVVVLPYRAAAEKRLATVTDR